MKVFTCLRASCMRFYVIFSVLFLLCGLSVLGCGESVEESDATILVPEEDFRFQDLPVLEDGSLIPPDKIPIVAIEKTREDAENVWWKLKADPVPSRGDLIVSIWRASRILPRKGRILLVSIPNLENNSVEMKTLRAEVVELSVGSFWGMMHNIRPRVFGFSSPFNDRELKDIFAEGVLPLPPFRLDDGYVAPQGFVFSYYLQGAESGLVIPANAQGQQ